MRPVGETREVPVDVRILSATHRRLDELVKGGRFREDLYYRINVINLVLPALRQRKDDIPMLVGFFLDRHRRSVPEAPSARARAQPRARSTPGRRHC